MCSDSLIQAEGVRTGSGKKITKTKDGWLAGAAGNYSEVSAFLIWAEERNPDEVLKLKNLGGILVSPEGKVFCIDDDLLPYEVRNDFHVQGSGFEIATGALAMGANAEEAVKVTIKYSTSCGGKIQKVSL
jgi:hypothetical protein